MSNDSAVRPSRRGFLATIAAAASAAALPLRRAAARPALPTGRADAAGAVDRAAVDAGAAAAHTAPDRRAVSMVLPMSSSVDILPGATASIRSRPQCWFRPTSMFIGKGDTRWMVRSVGIGNGQRWPIELTGDNFDPSITSLANSASSWGVLGPGVDIELVVTNIGDASAPFVCCVLGEAAQ